MFRKELKESFMGMMTEEEIEEMAENFAEAIIGGMTEEFDEMFEGMTGTYSISGNTLTITFYGDKQTFTRKE
jgi:hypothetical protein